MVKPIVSAVILLLLATIGVLAWQLNVEITAARHLTQEIHDLTAKLADKSAMEAAALEERCATQADKVFRQQGYSEQGGMQNGQTAVYQDHYNATLKKCFMTLEVTGISSSSEAITKFLVDAFEQRIYAEYDWISSNTKKYWEVPPFRCDLSPPSGDEISCHSDDEYKAFVARYMQ